MLKRYGILWLGFAVPDEIVKPLFEMDPSPAIQTHKFGWSFARALQSGFGEVTLVSSCPVQNYPLVRRIIFIGTTFKFHGMHGINLGFINLFLLKHLSRLLTCLVTALPLIRKERIDWIFIHGVHTPYLLFGLMTRLLGCSMAVVLTDPPGVILSTDGRVARLMKRVDAWLIKKILGHADAVFALAPDLLRRLAPVRPGLVFPGILESTLDAHVRPVELASAEFATRPFTIIYAGGLSQAYGVDRLIEAVMMLSPSVSVCLKLYGRGDQEVRIRQLTAKDSRFIYGGFVDTAALMPELCAADILINPRPTSELFASQSFPSKLIEYLATGRPVLTTRIPSIPDALKEQFFYIDNESAEGIHMAICALMDISASDRSKKGYAAQLFVRVNYSEPVIGRKIVEFINGLDFKTERND